VKNAIVKDTAEAPGGSASSDGPCALSMEMDLLQARVNILQNVLAVSHKYQVPRLQLWCEQQLCDRISKKQVCSILCQAHLYEAKQLENACLTFIKENMEAVVATPGFGSLSGKWPEVMLKINIFIAGLSESAASAAVKAQQHSMQKLSFAEQEEESEKSGTKLKRTE